MVKFFNDKIPITVLYATSQVIAQTLMTARGKDSAIQQISDNNRLPIHIEAGNCVVHSFINI